MPDNPQDFAQLIGNARQEMEQREQLRNLIRDQDRQLAAKKHETEIAFAQIRKEVEALRRQPSNIPAAMLDLRQDIANAIGVSESSLPFVGELLQVKSDEAQWQGAIERLLLGFALSLLVDERHYPALVAYANGNNLGKRLVYYRTGRTNQWEAKPVASNSLILKLNIKDSNYKEWLQTELRQRFDYACVDSIQAFRNAERALTPEGQLKHNKVRHEKDDRHPVNDPRRWVLGFDNRDKLALFEQHALDMAAAINQINQEINELATKESQRENRVIQCQTLANLQWQEIDLAPILIRINHVEKLINDTRDSNVALQQLSIKINEQKEKLSQADNQLREAMVKLESIRQKLVEAQKKLSALQELTIIPLTPYQQQGLDKRFAEQTLTLSLENLEKVTRLVEHSIHAELKTIDKQINECSKLIENQFAHFIRAWPAESADLHSSLDFAPEFLSKLTQLETDGLPAYEHRFFELLQNQSHQNLAALSTYLNDARVTILERMEMVNESLSQVPFNQTTDQLTYLRLEATDRQLPEVRQFKQDIQQALSHAWNDDQEFAEARFVALRHLVERLASQDPIQKRWREAVLDVRQHVEFIGREIDESGVEFEIYRSGAGKSGGQRQKLATTCLAAALRYQLGGIDHNVPLYAAVVLDEAFDKADNEFTALAMNIFANFGFQMIIATPLKSVMTLEPFIGGACFVDINDRRVSGVLLIEYDVEQQRLKLKGHHEEIHNETA